MQTKQASIPIVLVITIVVTVVGWVSQYYTQASAQSLSLSEIRTNIAVTKQIDAQQDINIEKLNQNISIMNENISLLLIRQGITPKQLKQ